MKFHPVSISCFSLFLVLLRFSVVVVAETPCLNYTKGSFDGDVTTKDICEDACQAAEGLPKPDFKECSLESTDELTNETMTMTFFQCACWKEGDNNRRGLCDDGLGMCVSGAGSKVIFGVAILSALASGFLAF